MINAIAKKLNRKNKKGFTLIELIVVIAIIAVLAAVGIPAIAGQVAKSNQSAADSTAKLLAEQGQILFTQAEARGDDLATMSAAVDDAAIMAAAGVDPADFDSVPAFTYQDIDENGGITGTLISRTVQTVTVVKGGKTGTFVRA